MSLVGKIFEIVLPKKRLNESLRILIITNTTMIFVLGMFAPFYAVFVKKIGGGIAFAGFSWALVFIVSGLLMLIFTNWQIKVKEQELMLALGYIIRGAVFLSYAFMTSIPQLILTQIVWGIAMAIGMPAFDAIYSSHTSKDNNSVVQWGQWEGLSALATGIASLIGGIIIQSFGYMIVFIAMAAISFFLGAYIWKLPREVL